MQGKSLNDANNLVDNIGTRFVVLSQLDKEMETIGFNQKNSNPNIF